MQSNAPKKDNHYFLDSEHPIEMARLVEQEEMITRVCGLLPPGLPEQTTRRILDIGCGPGGWVLAVATAYPDIQVTGIDISATMIDYAQNWAYAQQQQNALLLHGNFAHLPFTDGNFDLVYARLVQWFTPLEAQQAIFAEWLRVLRPGGTICFTEGSSVQTNSPVAENVFARFTQVAQKTGRHFPDKEQQWRLAESLGLEEIQQTEHTLDFSYGSADHDTYVRDMQKSLLTSKNYLIREQAYENEEEFDGYYEQYFVEVNAPWFVGHLPFVVTW
jgi:ubiquinone/menaquinone biosynthesis C-methylase UbiE